tara:strand:- start:865 stop:1140 length:276 start_codon:yes stop_codon:yes gene_type:complete
MNYKKNFYVCWHIDDVLQERPDLTPQQASEVLYKLCDPAEHDACIGVNWDSINIMCDMLFGEAPDENDTEVRPMTTDEYMDSLDKVLKANS